MAVAIVSAIFTYNGVGQTGLTATVTIEKIPIASGSPTVVVNAQTMTESSNVDGVYWYRTADIIDTVNNYYVLYATTAGAVDQSHVFADMIITSDFSASILSAVTTALGTMPGAIWAYVSRTLTTVSSSSAVSSNSATSGGAVSIHRGDSMMISITGLGDLTSRTNLWFTVKSSTDNADTASIIQIDENNGALYVIGASPTAAGNGVITVDNANSGAITITLDEVETAKLTAATGLVYDVQMLKAGNVTTLTGGAATITADVTKAIS